MSFESELEKGIFCIPRCNSCKKIVWPPSKICSHCLGPVSLTNGNIEGKIIEFSRKEENYFCIVEFEDEIKIVAKSMKIPEIGQKVKISKCGIEDSNNYFFYVN